VKRKKKTGTIDPASQKERLSGHPLVRNSLDNLIPLIDSMVPEIHTRLKAAGTLWNSLQSATELASTESDDSRFTEEQLYCLDIFSCLRNLVNAVERLEDICVYVSHFPQPRKFERQDITEDKWIQYHYSYFLITIVGIFDTALLLVNAALHLGIPPEQCKKRIVYTLVSANVEQ
jgi:hypothetical protein